MPVGQAAWSTEIRSHGRNIAPVPVNQFTYPLQHPDPGQHIVLPALRLARIQVVPTRFSFARPDSAGLVPSFRLDMGTCLNVPDDMFVGNRVNFGCMQVTCLEQL